MILLKNVKRNMYVPPIDESDPFLEVNSKNINVREGDKIYCKETHLSFMYDLYNKNSELLTFNPGKKINGIVSNIDKDFIYVDVGYKDFINCPVASEISLISEYIEKGMEVSVQIDGIIEYPYTIIGNISRQYISNVIDDLHQLSEQLQPIDAYIKEITSSGYSMTFNYKGIDFNLYMPFKLAALNKLADTEEIGSTLEVILESYDKKSNTWIVSRKRYLETLIPLAIEKIDYAKEYTGIITGTTEFGIFIEFEECLAGMIYNTNLDSYWKELLKNKEIQVGMEIKFYVKEILKTKIVLTQNNVVSLWDSLVEGQKLYGVIGQNKNSGLLVHFDEDTKGIIPSGELAKYPDMVFTEGSKIYTRIVSFDKANRRIFLVPLKERPNTKKPTKEKEIINSDMSEILAAAIKRGN